jgi:hypothetical protein
VYDLTLIDLATRQGELQDHIKYVRECVASIRRQDLCYAKPAQSAALKGEYLMRLGTLKYLKQGNRHAFWNYRIPVAQEATTFVSTTRSYPEI